MASSLSYHRFPALFIAHLIYQPGFGLFEEPEEVSLQENPFSDAPSLHVCVCDGGAAHHRSGCAGLPGLAGVGLHESPHADSQVAVASPTPSLATVPACILLLSRLQEDNFRKRCDVSLNAGFTIPYPNVQ